MACVRGLGGYCPKGGNPAQVALDALHRGVLRFVVCVGLLWVHIVTGVGAKIVTIGERAEDVFYVCLESGGALDESQQQQLGEALLQQLDSSNASK